MQFETDKEKIMKTGERANDLIIRRAVLDDYNAVSILEELEFNTHSQTRPDCFKSLEISYSRTEFEELLAMPCPIPWLAVKDGRVVGLCFGKIEATPESSVCKVRRVAFIQDIVTLPEFRGQGVATALMAKTKEQAIHEGAESLELCVWSFNEGAMRLYKKMGMQVQYYRMEERLTADQKQ